METRKPTSYTVLELKEIAKSEGVATNGTKAELIRRLTEHRADVWADLSEVISVSPIRASPSTVTQELGETVPVRDEIPDIVRRELELLRREKELLEREVELLRRESALRGTSPLSVTNSQRSNSNASINNVAGLLSEFTGADDSFPKWKKQVEMLQ
ncbi:hypothetical protein KPH14_012611, partial [Odynerus spinipes]